MEETTEDHSAEVSPSMCIGARLGEYEETVKSDCGRREATSEGEDDTKSLFLFCAELFTMTTLLCMPFEVLQHTLLYLSTVEDLNNCEKSCKALYNVVQDDQTWRCCKVQSPYPYPMSYRKRACIPWFLELIRTHKETTHSFLLEAISVEEWKGLIQRILAIFLPENVTSSHQYILRGDTLGVLLELVEATMIDQLQCANELCCETCDEGSFPVVTLKHLKLQEKLRSSRRLVLEESETYELWGTPIIPNANALVDAALRDKIIRKMAFRAGLVFMSNDVYEYLWASAVHTIILVLEPVCLQFYDDTRAMLADEPEQLTDQKRPLSPVETIRMVAPFSRKIKRHGMWHYIHTPVPRQIEDAASKGYLPISKVYGDVWLVSEGKTEEEEIEEACEAYTDDEEDDDDGEDYEEDEDEDYYSVYTDYEDRDDYDILHSNQLVDTSHTDDEEEGDDGEDAYEEDDEDDYSVNTDDDDEDDDEDDSNAYSDDDDEDDSNAYSDDDDEGDSNAYSDDDSYGSRCN